MSVLDNDLPRRPQRAIEHTRRTHTHETHTHTSPSVHMKIKEQDGGMKDTELA